MKTRKLLTLVIAIVTFAVTNMQAQTLPSYVPTNGLVGYWGFNGNANDLSGNGNNGTVNGATLTTDRNGNADSAYLFSNNYITIPNSTVFNSNDLSISFWINSSNVARQCALIRLRYTDAENEHFGILFSDLTQYGVELAAKYNNISCIPGEGWEKNEKSQNIMDSNFHHVVGTISGNSMNLYIDEVLVKTMTTLFPQTSSCWDGDIQIGRNWAGDIAYFQGKIDDIAIYNRALTQAEITQLYTSSTSTQNLCTKTIQPYNVNVGDATHDGSTYAWNILPAAPNAVITGNGTNEITIDWTTVPDGSYTLQAVETSIEGCVSTAVTATINLSATPAPIAQPQTFCNNATVANLVATGTDIKWYASANDGAALATTTPLTAGTYFASQTINSCESTRTTVNVSITPQVIPSFTQIDPYFLGASIQNLPTTSSNGIIGAWTPPINNQLTTTYVFSPNIGQCASNSIMTITILKHLSHSVITNNSSICPEDQATLTVIIDENKVVDIEGNIYQTVKIGSQLWMAEDLRVSTLNDGTLIPQLQSSIEWNNANDSAWCYNSANLSDCANIGKLYNFYTVSTNKMCPIGWHVPTFDEWFGESGLKTWVINSFPNQTSNSGGMLKITGTNEWNEPNEGAINLLNFNARPSGGRDLDGNFLTCGTKALYHINNTFGDGESHYVQLSNMSGDLSRISPWRGNAPETKKMGVSVRCLKN